jgi:hypothetical protein
MSGSAECRNHPPRGKRAQRQLLIGLTTRSPQRERMTRAFLLTMTYMDAGQPSITTQLQPLTSALAGFDECVGDFASTENPRWHPCFWIALAQTTAPCSGRFAHWCDRGHIQVLCSFF